MIHENHKYEVSPDQCPRCRYGGWWRTRLGFQHEKQCYACEIVWCPAKVYLWRAEQVEAMQGMFGDGI